MESKLSELFKLKRTYSREKKLNELEEVNSQIKSCGYSLETFEVPKYYVTF